MHANRNDRSLGSAAKLIHRVVGLPRRLAGRREHDAAMADGPTGTVKLSRVRDADEALELVADDLLGVSAGFAVHPTPCSEEWQGPSHKRIRRAILDHVALVVEAACPTAAVTAVRRSPTPNLDRVLAGA